MMQSVMDCAVACDSGATYYMVGCGGVCVVLRKSRLKASHTVGAPLD